MRNLSRAAIRLLIFSWIGAIGMILPNFVLAVEKIDINTAPLEDLVKIIHIGRARALELISLRPFSSLDELTKIKGIGEARIRDIKEQGLAWVAPGSSPESQPEPELQEEPQIEAASAGLQISKSPIPLFVLLIASFLAISSGITILFLKKKLIKRIDL